MEVPLDISGLFWDQIWSESGLNSGHTVQRGTGSHSCEIMRSLHSFFGRKTGSHSCDIMRSLHLFFEEEQAHILVMSCDPIAFFTLRRGTGSHACHIMRSHHLYYPMLQI